MSCFVREVYFSGSSMIKQETCPIRSWRETQKWIRVQDNWFFSDHPCFLLKNRLLLFPQALPHSERLLSYYCCWYYHPCVPAVFCPVCSSVPLMTFPSDILSCSSICFGEPHSSLLLERGCSVHDGDVSQHPCRLPTKCQKYSSSCDKQNCLQPLQGVAENCLWFQPLTLKNFLYIVCHILSPYFLLSLSASFFLSLWISSLLDSLSLSLSLPLLLSHCETHFQGEKASQTVPVCPANTLRGLSIRV